MRLAVRDITAILQVHCHVAGSQFDRAIMPQPEFLLATRIVFCTDAHGGTQMHAAWRTFRTFAEFQSLDVQLRRTFPRRMELLAPPPPHVRRTWLHRHRQATFLAKRCAELNLYLEQLLVHPHLRLTKFLDPQAPLLLRCFCNFDAGFSSADVTQVANPHKRCVLYLNSRNGFIGRNGILETANDDESTRQFESSFRRRATTASWHSTKEDELQANLMDDKSRHVATCIKYECTCRMCPFQAAYTSLLQLLRVRGFQQLYAPPEGANSALYCVLYRLQQLNDLDKRLFDAFTEFPPPSGGTIEAQVAMQNEAIHRQLATTVELLRQTVANYGLLHVDTLSRHFHMSIVDLKKRLHEFQSRDEMRVGAVELVILTTMLDLSITLITNDHEETEQQIMPLEGFRSIRNGGRVAMTFGYILPTLVCLNGYYLLAEPVAYQDQKESSVVTKRQQSRMWLGIDEMDRCFMAEIELTVATRAETFSPVFDLSMADSLNSAILSAVWDDCSHNPNTFHLFERQARQFGKGRTTAHGFMQYLEVAFGFEGATYLVDFLLHVLPEKDLCKKLLHVRWMRVHRQLAKRVSP
ncbi:hypothetical protein CCR75_006343 [Bremia lactucae]|uniref:PX domain-containing protein n=1 Tax=Bremia lactucae TaxID=4779 RepID=A0A976FQN9_BRELC|nr:hypothetical protein CCR75_006343 [Bremia lactucae]